MIRRFSANSTLLDGRLILSAQSHEILYHRAHTGCPTKRITIKPDRRIHRAGILDKTDRKRQRLRRNEEQKQGQQKTARRREDAPTTDGAAEELIPESGIAEAEIRC